MRKRIGSRKEMMGPYTQSYLPFGDLHVRWHMAM